MQRVLTYDPRNPTQDGETDVNKEVGTASSLKEDSQRRQEDGDDVGEDVGLGVKMSISIGFAIGEPARRLSHG
jgi:hypothetical protein